MSNVSAILSVVFFYLAAIFFIVAWLLIRLQITEVVYTLYILSLTAGTVAATGCLICAYLAIGWPRTKILKETYFYVAFVPLFSILLYVILKLGLNVDFPVQPLIVISIVSGTLLSCVFAGYSTRKTLIRLRRLGLTQGITIFTLILLGLIPIIEILPTVTSWKLRSMGFITYEDIVFESGSDTTKVQGQISKSVFTAKVPIPTDITFIAERAVNITNKSPNSLDLKIYLEGLRGNLSKVRQLKIFFILGNGSEICPFSINNGNVKCEEVCLGMKSRAPITMGVISLAQNVSSTDVIVMSLLMECKEHDLSMNISIDSV